MQSDGGRQGKGSRNIKSDSDLFRFSIHSKLQMVGNNVLQRRKRALGVQQPSLKQVGEQIVFFGRDICTHPALVGPSLVSPQSFRAWKLLGNQWKAVGDRLSKRRLSHRAHRIEPL